MGYTIEVTQDDIDSGRRHSCIKCPVALAMMRAVPAEEVQIHSYYGVVFYKDNNRNRFALPPAVIEFVDKFDHWAEVAPFTFTI